MAKLKTETNTPEMAARIESAFGASNYAFHKGPDVTFEHGQHYVCCTTCGAQYSVVDAEGGPSVDGFDFEEITEGDGYCAGESD